MTLLNAVAASKFQDTFFSRWIWHAWAWYTCDLLDRVCRPCWRFVSDKPNLLSTVECFWIQRNHWSAKCSPSNASRRWRNVGCFPLCQRFRKFRSEFKWKGPFRFLPTGIFGSPLEVVLIFRLEYSDRNVLFHLQTFWFPVALFCHLLFPSWPILRAYNLLRVTNVPFVAILQQTFPNY